MTAHIYGNDYLHKSVLSLNFLLKIKSYKIKFKNKNVKIK